MAVNTGQTILYCCRTIHMGWMRTGQKVKSRGTDKEKELHAHTVSIKEAQLHWLHYRPCDRSRIGIIVDYHSTQNLLMLGMLEKVKARSFGQAIQIIIIKGKWICLINWTASNKDHYGFYWILNCDNTIGPRLISPRSTYYFLISQKLCLCKTTPTNERESLLVKLNGTPRSRCSVKT